MLKDAIELGVVFIGSENHGYSVRECVPKGTRGNKWKCGVIVETPDRQFVFMCEQERDQREWVEALKTVISKPMMPQDYTSKTVMIFIWCVSEIMQNVTELLTNIFYFLSAEANIRRRKWT